ncbi:isochorismatase family protein [Bifidobacterium criceti]|uniref:nicotinamidase n=1 Tax=Bifidobacterium criceti TaxID=1960969 RepID=A0A2A2EDK4_9BIFI|nr:isochorismatase family protein [Bifidobacterium criceti]PAU67052.1 nicotinamidase [Bifidobacterium criceti]
MEGGELAVVGGNAVAERIRGFVERNRGRYALIATTQDWHIEPGSHWSDNPDFVDTWPVHGAAGTPNALLHPAIESLHVPHHIKKGQYSAAYSGFEGVEDNGSAIPTRDDMAEALAAGRTLDALLAAEGVSRVDIVGIALSHCVRDTALDAAARGYEVRVYEDLSVPVSEELGKAAVEQMRQAGITIIEGDEYVD